MVYKWANMDFYDCIHGNVWIISHWMIAKIRYISIPFSYTRNFQLRDTKILSINFGVVQYV